MFAGARGDPVKPVAGIAKLQAGLIRQRRVGFFDVHAAQADAAAQAGEFFRRQLINEEHHRGGLRVDAQHFVIGPNGRSHQYCGPAVEQHVFGNLLAFGSDAARLGDDRA
ncbi:hypothetical protein D3C79_828950 [compost metagenome]